MGQDKAGQGTGQGRVNYFLVLAFSGIAVFLLVTIGGALRKITVPPWYYQVLETLDSKLICSPFFNIFLEVTLVSLILHLKVTLVESHKVFCFCGQVLTWGQKSRRIYHPLSRWRSKQKRGRECKSSPKNTKLRSRDICLFAQMVTQANRTATGAGM